MNLTYRVEKEDYREAIEFQLRLKQNTLISKISYWVVAWGLVIICIYFALTRTSLSAFVRFAPLVLSSLMLAFASYLRFGIKYRSGKIMQSFEKTGTLEKGYLGKHKLSVNGEFLNLQYGNTNKTIKCSSVGDIYQGEKDSFIIADGVMFEIIPNEVLDRDGNREKLTEEIRCAIESEFSGESRSLEQRVEADQPRTLVKADTDMERSVKGLVTGYRMFYTTRDAWAGHQTVRMLILVYGIFIAATGLNVYLGLGFTLIGIFLNRQFFMTMSPMVYSIARKTIMGERTEKSSTDYYYTTDYELVSIDCGRVKRCRKSEIKTKRKTKNYFVYYTSNKNMIVIPRMIMPSANLDTRFEKLM